MFCKKNLASFFLTVIIGMTAAFSAQAEQVKIQPHHMVMAKRAAELDAYRQMAERIMGLKISASSTVKDFVGESDRIAVSMANFIKGIRIDDDLTCWYDDGSCEVVARVTLSQVINELKKTSDQQYDGEEWTKENFEKIKTYTEEKEIQVLGSAAVRPESQIKEVEAKDIIMDMSNTRSRNLNLAPVYKQYGAQNRLTAKRVAQVDAYRKLAERINGLHITANTTVADFAKVNDNIRLNVDAFIKGARVENVRYQPDGIVEVQVSVTLEQIIKTLKKVCDEYYDGEQWVKKEFDEIQNQTKHRVITVLGMGALTPEYESKINSFAGNGEVVMRRVISTTIIDEGVEVMEIK